MNTINKSMPVAHHLQILINEIGKDLNKNNLETDVYLLNLRDCCVKLARIVHTGQLDKAGAPYIQHPLRVADKANNVLMYCAGVLHDVLEDGKHLGITKEFLIEELMLPVVLVNLIDSLSRREGESYNDYLQRVIWDYNASKIKMDDCVDNANVIRFSQPTLSDYKRACDYLEKAMKIKNYPDFQAEMPFDYINELTALAAVSPMIVDIDVATIFIDTTMIFANYNFGYDGYQQRRYVLKFIGTVDDDTGVVKATLVTYPCVQKYADEGLYKARKLSLTFPSVAATHEYIGHTTARIRTCSNMRSEGFGLEALRLSTESLTAVEMEVLTQFNKNHD